MLSAFGQFASTSQFYLFGRSRCTKTGWEKASKDYPKPDMLERGADSEVDLSGKIFMVTGANAGVGREVSTFLARNSATVYMVCRSVERGTAARNDIAALSKNENVHLIIGDCSLEKGVRHIWADFESHRHLASPGAPLQLHGLLCNAGALLSELTLTEEEVEVTFAGHLLFGTYLLGTLAMPTLQATPSSRLVAVSSGGMYNSKFPAWEDATSTGAAKYDGQFAYVYAKRGQVLLCEEWAREFGSQVKVVSCHPGRCREVSFCSCDCACIVLHRDNCPTNVPGCSLNFLKYLTRCPDRLG
jgi:dehydrogenase/reductase SDR family protein 12